MGTRSRRMMVPRGNRDDVGRAFALSTPRTMDRVDSTETRPRGRPELDPEVRPPTSVSTPARVESCAGIGPCPEFLLDVRQQLAKGIGTRSLHRDVVPVTRDDNRCFGIPADGHGALPTCDRDLPRQEGSAKHLQIRTVVAALLELLQSRRQCPAVAVFCPDGLPGHFRARSFRPYAERVKRVQEQRRRGSPCCAG